MHGLLCVLLTVGALGVPALSRSTDGWKSTSVQQDSARDSNVSLPELTVGLIVPHTNFGAREYTRAINKAVVNLRKGYAKTKAQSKFTFLEKYNFTQPQVRNTMMRLTPSPTGKYFPETSRILFS